MFNTIPEYLLIAGSGILGSAHCLGMCGGISASLNIGAAGRSAILTRQLMWSAGRTFTYAFLGLFAAEAGRRFSTAFDRTSLIQAVMAIVAGLLLVFQGMLAAGWFRRRTAPAKTGGCLTAGLLAPFLKGGSAIGTLIAGVFTGFLPCGLVYSFLALAAGTDQLWKGPAVMLAFGMGTVPVMLLAGLGWSMTTLQLRQRLFRGAAICIMLTGLITVGRGIAFAARPHDTEITEACPLCADEHTRNTTSLQGEAE